MTKISKFEYKVGATILQLDVDGKSKAYEVVPQFQNYDQVDLVNKETGKPSWCFITDVFGYDDFEEHYSINAQGSYLLGYIYVYEQDLAAAEAYRISRVQKLVRSLEHYRNELTRVIASTYASIGQKVPKSKK